MFSFPKDDERKNKWLDSLPNEKGSVPVKKNNGVCIKHFLDADVTGQARKSLSPTAVPCIFNGVCTSVPKRKSIDTREEEILTKAIKLSEQSFAQEKEQRQVSCFQSIIDNIELINHSFLIEQGDDFIFFL